MKSRIITSLLFIQIFISSLYAQGNWSWVNPIPQGNLLNGVHFVNDNVGWAVGKMGYILKTTNGGQTWVNQNSTTTAQLNAVQFLNENVGFVVGDSGRILKTTNGGNTWIRLTSSYNYWISSLHFINENYGWLGAGNYILATTNGGANWTGYYQGAPFGIYDVYFLNQTTGFWVGFGGLNKTTNGGQTFSYVWNVPDNYSWDEIEFINSSTGWIVGDGGKMAKTTDGGTTWVEVGGVTSSGGMYFKDENNGWIANYNGIYRTQNSGSSWTLTPIKNMMDVYFVQNAGYAVGAGGKIFKTTNLGDNWVPSYQNIAQDRRLAGIFFNDPSVGFAVGDSGKILKTDNDGNTWIPQTSPSNTNLTSVFFADVNTGWITGYNVILKTTNSGNSWRLKYTGNYENLNNLFFLNSQTGWVVGDNIKKTEDGGNTWTEQTLTDVYGEYYLKGVYFIDANKGFVVGPSGWLFKTTNGGSNWNKVVTPTSVNLNKIKFLDNLTGWIVGDQGTILQTTNGGINWDILNFGQNYSLLDFQIIDAQTLWAVGGTTYSDYGSFTLYTTDGGDTWKNIINPNSQCLYGVCFLDKNTGWAVGEQGSMINYLDNQAIPSAPGNLIASAISGKVNLSWIDNSFDETGFEIYRSDYYSGNYKKIATVNPNISSYKDNNVNSLKTYWYRIRAINSIGSSALCREDSVTTTLPLPSTPTLVSPLNNSVDKPVSFSLVWHSSTSAETYHCQVATDIEFKNLVIDDSTLVSTSKSISGLINNTLYFWRVLAKNSVGISPWSEIWNFTTQAASSVEKLDNTVPGQFSLKQNYPNPFNPTTVIEFDLAEANFTDLSLYDNLGRLVKILFRGEINPGRYRVILNAEDLTSGIYYYRIYSGKNLQSKKMLLIK